MNFLLKKENELYSYKTASNKHFFIKKNKCIYSLIKPLLNKVVIADKLLKI